CTNVAAILPIAIFPLGTSTAHVRPAFAAYAAADADVLPVEAHTTACAPSSAALEIASVIPRSLKEPVGFDPSYFSHTSAPVVADKASLRTSGVPPSRSVMTGVASVTGSRSRYSSISPRHWCAPRVRMSEPALTPRPPRGAGSPRHAPSPDRGALGSSSGTDPPVPGA